MSTRLGWMGKAAHRGHEQKEICTPDRCLRSDGKHLLCAPTIPSAGRPAPDAGDVAWATALEGMSWA